MKSLFFILSVISFSALADFSKPELLLRFMFTDAWRVPDNLWCFSGEPVIIPGGLYLNCLDSDGSLMLRLNGGQVNIEARAKEEQLFSKPQVSSGQVSWYEFNESGVSRVFQADKGHRNFPVLGDAHDSVLALSTNQFFFRSKGEVPQLFFWKDDQITPFFQPKVLYLFPPQIGNRGEVVIKTRDKNLDEKGVDQLWYFDGEWKIIFEDQDANPNSSWVSFRHQTALHNGKVLIFAHDGKSDQLLLLQNGKIEVIAKEGKDVKSFDYFSPRLIDDVIVFRGEDLSGNKAIFVREDNTIVRKLVSHGDIIKTDRGDARISYKDRNALFYGAPGIDEKGNVYFQATLTDADFPETLLGVGLIKMTRKAP